MKIAIGSDHAGFELKQEIRQFMAKLGHAIKDLGACNAEASDYPCFPEIWGRMPYCEYRGSRHLTCGSGTGVCVAANKVPSIRAASVMTPTPPTREWNTTI